jgi:hypothetical protein
MGNAVIRSEPSTIGPFGINNVVNTTDGLTQTFIVRTPDTGVFIGGENLYYQQQLGTSGNPASAGFELTPNKEYEFTVRGQTQGSATSLTYTVFLYNSNASVTVSYDIVITTQ